MKDDKRFRVGVIILASLIIVLGLMASPRCFGQDTENVYTPPMAGGQFTIEPPALNKYGFSEKINWSKEYIVIALLTLYDQYKEACYNDSTEVTFGYFRSWDFGGEFKAVYEPRSDEISFNLIRTEQGHTHAEPTFTGFMKFIREKQN